MPKFTEQVEKYFSFDDFIYYYKKIANSEKKKTRRANMMAFYESLRVQLENGTYQPKSYNCFFVKDPQPREIFSPYFDDRIIHHLVIRLIYPMQKNFIEDSFANQAGKGTHKAIYKLQYYMRQYKQSECCYMQCDVKSYFVSINKHILFKIIFKQMDKMDLSKSDREFIVFLLNKIILQDPTKNPVFTGNRKLLEQIPKHKSLFYQQKHKGLPIGAHTSQFESLLYLNELDWFVKENLQIEHYIRYVDDFVILGNGTKSFNTIRKNIEDFLQNNLELTLHPNKTNIQHITKGVNFLGYIVRPHYLLVRKRNIHAIKDKLRFFNWLINPQDYKKNTVKKYFETNSVSKLYRKGLIKEGQEPTLLLLNGILQTINSYYGIFAIANSYNLRVNIYNKYFENLKEYFVPKNSFRAFILKPSYIYNAGDTHQNKLMSVC